MSQLQDALQRATSNLAERSQQLDLAQVNISELDQKVSLLSNEVIKANDKLSFLSKWFNTSYLDSLCMFRYSEVATTVLSLGVTINILIDSMLSLGLNAVAGLGISQLVNLVLKNLVVNFLKPKVAVKTLVKFVGSILS